MSAHIEPQVITYNGKPAFAVIPWDVYERLTSGSKEADIWFPNDVVKANTRGDNLIKAWRDHFGLTQAELAERAGMKQAALARLETSKSTPRRPTIDRLAAAMGIDPEQLME